MTEAAGQAVTRIVALPAPARASKPEDKGPGAPRALMAGATLAEDLWSLARNVSALFAPWLATDEIRSWANGGKPCEPDPEPGDAGDVIDREAPAARDRLVHALMGRVTGGIAPQSVALAFADWAFHMVTSPGKQQHLTEKALRKWLRLALYTRRALGDPDCAPCIEPLPFDNRFRAPSWHVFPFNLIHQSFLLTQQLAHNATSDVRGMSPEHARVVNFVTRQMLDVFSPSNFLATNPELMAATIEEGGQNLLRGAVNLIEDFERAVAGRPPVGSGRFRPGRDVALTQGKVVFRNHLIELIQYAPTTTEVAAEPLLIVPAWIMKYYILDLTPETSFIGHLVNSGFTVFCISWRNPTAADRDLGLDDYRNQGISAALRAINTILPERKVHALGYCLGGTLLATAAAQMARDKDDRLGSLTLLAAQTDFRDAGELMLFIDEAQIAFLEDIMWDQGYLDTTQMAGAFQLLRSNELIWSRNLKTYLMGTREPVTPLTAWNADATRMPYRMHSEYLSRLFLKNDLAEGRHVIDGRPVALSDIRVPVFLVGTETDHVAPWRSVYRFHLMADAEVTFLLTNGGHNVGIVSEPGHPGRHFRQSARAASDPFIDPETWLASTPIQDGSWWRSYVEWLNARTGDRAPAPPMGARDEGLAPLSDAPGQNVLQR